MNIVIYARFSSHSQNEQSIEGQLNVCYEYANRNGYDVIGEYIDRAISGTAADNRPEFQRMIADSVKRQFQAVLVYQLDRFARNRYDSATYKTKLKKNGVKVLSARENITDDASGVLMEAVLEGMAEYYSVELSQKIRRGMSINAEKCLATGGNVALGYKIDEDKRFAINEEEASIVKRIFEMYLAGSTMAQIIRYLNENQIKTSRGNEYNKNSIRGILTNKRYCGVYTFNGTEIAGGMPRIIDDITFAETQILMEKNKKTPARAKAVGEFYLLTTKLFCGHCEAAMVGVSGTSHTGKIHQYYQCVTNRRRNCKKKTVQKAYIEDLVVEKVKNLLTDENIDRIAVKVSDLCQKERNTDTLKRLNKQLKENEAATNNLVKALECVLKPQTCSKVAQ
jgi:DNA invertase Pin-like site-specific DNA recombinase